MIYLFRFDMDQNRHVDVQRYRESAGMEGVSPRVAVNLRLEFEYEPGTDRETVGQLFDAVRVLTEKAHKCTGAP